MFFAIDIDGTIAGRNEQRFAEECNRIFNLGMNSEELEHISYITLMEQPALRAYRERVGTEHFETAVYEIAQDPAMLGVLPPFLGAVRGVAQLATVGDVGYYTVRKHRDPERNRQIEQATTQWLARHCFAHPEHIVFCRSVMHKIVQLYEREKDHQYPLVLIDDRWKQVLEAIDEIAAGLYHQITDHLLPCLTVVAFGVNALPTITNGFRVERLPSWENLDDTLSVFL